MNTPKSYEILIAKKVALLPVPDMADSIWASIEMQLDAGDFPDGGEEALAPKTPPGKSLPAVGKGMYFFMAAAIVVTLSLVYTKKEDASQKDKLPQTVPASQSTKTPAPTKELKNVPLKVNIDVVQPPAINKNAVADNGTAPIIKRDSLSNCFLHSPAVDSPVVKNDRPPQLPIDSALLSPPPAKPKGIKGITDSDYKIISGKKDSLKKIDR